MKRLLLGLLFVGVAASTVLVGAWRYAGQPGSSTLEQWVGRQIVGIIDSHLTATLDFETLDYQAPYTVVIDGMTLVSASEPILSVDRATLELAEIPREGAPIRIRRIELNRPDLRFVRSDDGSFVGWSGLVEPGVAADPSAVASGQRLSEVLVLERVAVRDGRMSYQSGGQIYSLPKINLTLNTPPISAEPGWYDVSGVLERAPLFRMEMDGRLNLDTGLLDVEELAVAAVLGDAHYDTLGLQERESLQSHDIQGELRLRMQGQIPLSDPAQASVTVDLEVDDASVQLAGRVWPLPYLLMEAVVGEGVANACYLAGVLGGHFGGRAVVDLTAPLSVYLTWQADGMRMEETLCGSQNSQKQERDYEGRIDSWGELTVTREVEGLLVTGGGEVNIREGRLVNIPVIKGIVAMVDKARAGIGMSGKGTDKAKVVFALHGDHAYLSELKVYSSLVAIQGKGRTYYDGRLDLDVTAGALGNLQAAMGMTGEWRDKLNIKMITYKVKGNVETPKIRVQPLGLGG